MAYESNVGKFILDLDISATETPNYQTLNIMGITHDLGEISDTWNDLTNAISNTVKLAIDPTYSVTAKVNVTDSVAQFILSKEHAVGENAVCGARITNLIKGKVLDFDATISNIAYDPTADGVLELSFDLKVYDASTFIETNYTPA